MSYSHVSMLLRNKELERKLEDLERKTGSTGTSYPLIAMHLKNQELEQRLKEITKKAVFTGTNFPFSTIQLKNLELERKLEEMERKVVFLDTSSPSCTIHLKNLELERKLEEMERKVIFPDTSSPCCTIHLKNQELDRKLEEMAQPKAVLHQHELKLAEVDWRGCFPSTRCVPTEVRLKIQLENQEFRKKLAELEKGSSPFISFAPEGIHEKSQEHYWKVVDLWKAAGMLQNERLKTSIAVSQEFDLAFLVDATGSMKDVLDSIKDPAEEIA